MKHLFLAVSVLAMAVSPAFAARDQIRIVGSSTVYPFTTSVAEAFGKATKMKTPVVESTGTGGGMKLFCAGVGEDKPDFTNASRRIKKSEFDDCVKNGVTEIVEIKVGRSMAATKRKREPIITSPSARCARISLMDHLPGAGRHSNSLSDKPSSKCRRRLGALLDISIGSRPPMASR